MNNLVVTASNIQTMSMPSNSLWGTVQKLWKQIEKSQERNQRYDKKITLFLEQFRLDLEGTEQDVCIVTEQFIEHLIGFISRKSIKGTLRDTLYDWIKEKFDVLEANPFRMNSTQPLREKYQQALLKAHPKEDFPDLSKEDCDAIRIEFSIFTGLDIDISDEQLKEMVKDPEMFKQYTQDLQEEVWKRATENRDDSDFDDDTCSFFNDVEEDYFIEVDSDISALFEHKEIHKLYKQLARQLHPDRVQDLDKKNQHHELMQQLSNARKDNDIFSMLMLAQTWLPDFEMNLDEKVLHGLTQNLQRKIDQLDMEYRLLKMGPDLKSQVWHRFGGGNKKSRKKELEDYKFELTMEAQEMTNKIKSMRTVQDIQLVLRERLDALEPMFPFFDGPISISELDDIFNSFK